MAFKEASVTYSYVDISEAITADRLKVTFENGREVYFRIPVRPEGRRNTLIVDRELTDAEILDELYEGILRHEAHQPYNRRLFGTKKLTVADIRDKCELFIQVWKSRRDESPQVGQTLRVWGTMSGAGTLYWVASGSSVKSVEPLSLK